MAVPALGAAAGGAVLPWAAGAALPALAAVGTGAAAGIPVWAWWPASPLAPFSAAIIHTAMASRPDMATAARPFTVTTTAAATSPNSGGRTVLTWRRSVTKQVCDRTGSLLIEVR